MQFTLAAMKMMEEVRYCLDVNRFPELAKYRERIGALDKMKLQDATSPMNDALDDQPEGMTMGSGLSVQLFSRRAHRESEPILLEYLSLIREIRAEKTLMDREVYLRQYLGYLSENLERAVSERPDALDLYQTEMTGVATLFGSGLTKIPLANEAAFDPAVQAVFDHMENTSQYYLIRRLMKEQLEGKTADITESEYTNELKYRLTKCRDSLGRISALQDDQIRSFSETWCGEEPDAQLGARDPGMVRAEQDKMNTLLIDVAHGRHGAGSALKQVDLDLDMLALGTHPETTDIIREVVAQLNGPMGELAASQHRPENLLGMHGEAIRKCKKIIDDCNAVLVKDGGTGGFSDAKEEEQFLYSLTTSLREVNDILMTSRPADKTGLTEEQLDGLKVTSTIAGEIRAALQAKHSILHRLENEMDPRCLSVNGIEKRKGLHARLRPFQKLMQNTGSGWLGHKNSDEYETMMTRLAEVVDFSKKDALDRTERIAMRGSLIALENACDDYLAGKGKSFTTDTGRERFAGAMGVLAVIQPQKAQQQLRRVQTLRNEPELSIEDLMAEVDPFQPENSETFARGLKRFVSDARWKQYLGEVQQMQDLTGIPMANRTSPTSHFYMYLLAKTDLTAGQVLHLEQQGKARVAGYLDAFVADTMALKDKSEEERAEWFGSIKAGTYRKLGEYRYPDTELPKGPKMGDMSRIFNIIGNVLIDCDQDLQVYTDVKRKTFSYYPSFLKGFGGLSEYERLSDVLQLGQNMRNFSAHLMVDAEEALLPGEKPVGKADNRYIMEKLWGRMRGQRLIDSDILNQEMIVLDNLGGLKPTDLADDEEAKKQAEAYIRKGGKLPWADETERRIREAYTEQVEGFIGTGLLSDNQLDEVLKTNLPHYIAELKEDIPTGVADVRTMGEKRLNSLCRGFCQTFAEGYTADIAHLLNRSGKTIYDCIKIDGQTVTELGDKYADLPNSFERERAMMAEVMLAALDPAKTIELASVSMDADRNTVIRQGAQTWKAPQKQAAAVKPEEPQAAAAPKAEESTAEAPKPTEPEAPKAEEPKPETAPKAEEPAEKRLDTATLEQALSRHPYNLVSATAQERADQIDTWKEIKKQLHEENQKYANEAAMYEQMLQVMENAPDREATMQTEMYQSIKRGFDAYREKERLESRLDGYIEIAESFDRPMQPAYDMMDLDPAPKLRPQVIAAIDDMQRREDLVTSVREKVYQEGMAERKQKGLEPVDENTFYQDPDIRDIDKMCIIPANITEPAKQEAFVRQWLKDYTDIPDGRKKCTDDYFDAMESLSVRNLDLSCLTKSGDPEKNAPEMTKSEKDFMAALILCRNEQTRNNRSYDKTPEYGRQRYGSAEAQHYNTALLVRDAGFYFHYFSSICSQNEMRDINFLEKNIMPPFEVEDIAKTIVGSQQVFERKRLALMGQPVAGEHRVEFGYTARNNIIQVMPGMDREALLKKAEQDVQKEQETVIRALHDFDDGKKLSAEDVRAIGDIYQHNIQEQLKLNEAENIKKLQQYGLQELDLLYVDGRPLREFVGSKYGDPDKADDQERKKIESAMAAEYMLAAISGKHRTEVVEINENAKGEPQFDVIAARVDASTLDKADHGRFRRAFDFGLTKIEPRSEKQNKLWENDPDKGMRRDAIRVQFAQAVQKGLSKPKKLSFMEEAALKEAQAAAQKAEEPQAQAPKAEAPKPDSKTQEGLAYLAALKGAEADSLANADAFYRTLDSVYINGLAASEYFKAIAPELQLNPPEGAPADWKPSAEDMGALGNRLKTMVEKGAKDDVAAFYVAVEDEKGMLTPVKAVAGPQDDPKIAEDYNRRAEAMHADLNKTRMEALQRVQDKPTAERTDETIRQDAMVEAVRVSEGQGMKRRLVGLSKLMDEAGMGSKKTDFAAKRAEANTQKQKAGGADSLSTETASKGPHKS